ncbi:unnamed protein product [Ectocarpus sp. 6 AP-2014]
MEFSVQVEEGECDEDCDGTEGALTVVAAELAMKSQQRNLFGSRRVQGRAIAGLSQEFATHRRETRRHLSEATAGLQSASQAIAEGLMGVREDLCYGTTQLTRGVAAVKSEVGTVIEKVDGVWNAVESGLLEVNYAVRQGTTVVYRSLEELKGDMARMERSVIKAGQDNLLSLQNVSSRLENFERNMERRDQERDRSMLETEGRKASNYLNKFAASCEDVRSLDLANDSCQNILANRPRLDTLDLHFTAGVVAVATSYAKNVQLTSSATAKKTVFDGEVRNISESLKPIWADSSAVLTSTWEEVVIYLLDIASSICILPPEGVLLSPLDSQLVEAFGVLCASQPSLRDRFPEVGGASLRTLLQAKTLNELCHASNVLKVDTSRCDNKADLIQRLLDEGKPLHAALNTEQNTDEETKTDNFHDQGEIYSVAESDTSSDGDWNVWAANEENDVGRSETDNDTLEALKTRRMARWAR